MWGCCQELHVALVQDAVWTEDRKLEVVKGGAVNSWVMSLCERESCLGFIALSFTEVQEPSILLSLPGILRKKGLLKGLLHRKSTIFKESYLKGKPFVVVFCTETLIVTQRDLNFCSKIVQHKGLAGFF